MRARAGRSFRASVLANTPDRWFTRVAWPTSSVSRVGRDMKHSAWVHGVTHLKCLGELKTQSTTVPLALTKPGKRQGRGACVAQRGHLVRGLSLGTVQLLRLTRPRGPPASAAPAGRQPLPERAQLLLVGRARSVQAAPLLPQAAQRQLGVRALGLGGALLLRELLAQRGGLMLRRRQAPGQRACQRPTPLASAKQARWHGGLGCTRRCSQGAESRCSPSLSLTLYLHCGHAEPGRQRPATRPACSARRPAWPPAAWPSCGTLARLPSPSPPAAAPVAAHEAHASGRGCAWIFIRSAGTPHAGCCGPDLFGCVLVSRQVYNLRRQGCATLH